MITKFDEIFLKIRNKKGDVVLNGRHCGYGFDVDKFDDEHHDFIDYLIHDQHDRFFKKGYTISLHHSYGEWDEEEETDHWWEEEGEELETLSFHEEKIRKDNYIIHWIAEHAWRKVNRLINSTKKWK